MTGFGKLVVAGVLVLIVAIGAGVYYLAHRTAGTTAVACTAEAKLCPNGTAVGRTGPNCEFAPCPASVTLNTDVYPLYSGAEWQPATSTTMLVGTTSLSGYSITSAPAATTTTDVASVATPFVTYYDKTLTAAGWKEDTGLAADGAGSSERVYKKDTAVIVISYSSNFKDQSEDVPAQCPCTVSLSIFSANTAK